MGPQFAHLQTFSRKKNPAGQCVSQVLGELLRILEFSHHVARPAPPELVDGITPEQLRIEHDAMILTATTLAMVKGEPQYRAIRKDRHTLMTAVVSYPLTHEEIGQDPRNLAALRDWEALNVAFFRRQFGEHYRSSVRHVDESRPHLHIYGLPVGIDGVDATRLHPGKSAKQAEMARMTAEGAEAKAATAAGNRAFRAAMREWQDLYHREVGEPAGLLRSGPKRRRLSRAQYMAEKQAARLRRPSELELRQRAIDEAARQADARAAGLRDLEHRLEAEGRAIETRHQRLLKARHIAEEQAAGLRELAQRLEEERNLIAERERKQRHREAEISAVATVVMDGLKRMRRIMGAVGAFLGLRTGNGRSVERELTAIEEAVSAAVERIVPEAHPVFPAQEGGDPAMP